MSIETPVIRNVELQDLARCYALESTAWTAGEGGSAAKIRTRI